MEELNSSNVLEFWKNATAEQQKENIDTALELISSDKILDFWIETKKQIKCQNPNLIIRIIIEKQNNGKMYTAGLWSNTPSEVQEQTIEEVFQLYKSELIIRKIWRETKDSVKEVSKGALANALNYDKILLKKYDIPEYIPAPPGMLGKEQIDDIVWGLMQLKSWEITLHNQSEAKSMMAEEMPITSIPYFFKQILEEIPENYVKLFWNSIEKDIQYMIIEDVLRQIPSKELCLSIWNEFSHEMQKRKIKELVKNNNASSGCFFISITEVQTIREVLEEMINKNEVNIDGIWRSLPQEIQLEYFENVIKISDDEEMRDYIWQESAEQVQRSNFLQMLQEKNDDIDSIIDMMKSSKLSTAEIIEFILEKYEGKELEEIVTRYSKPIDVASLEVLKGKISPELSINLVIKNASELSTEKLDELSKNFNIKTIQMKDDNLDYNQSQPYDVETYKKCRETIDELLDGIELSQDLDNLNRDKRVFGEVIKRLAKHMSYDYESYEKIKKGESVSNDCADLVGGLLQNTCVCSGYAEIVRNVFSCSGIDVRYISGDNIEPGEHGHAWNQIKLDGTWYNMDLTWDRDRIIAGDTTIYLLMSDKDFFGHDKFDTKDCKKEQCSETVSYQDMQWYMYKKLEIPKTVDTSVRRTRRRRVERAYNMIAASQELSTESSEKREEQWIN